MHVRLRLAFAAGAALFLMSSAVGAAPVAEPVSLEWVKSPAHDRRETPAFAPAEPASATLATSMPVTLAFAQVSSPGRVELAGVRYRPRSRGSYGRRQPESSGVSQVHAGFFDPDGDQDSRFDIGVRGGPMLDQHVQLGLGVDWIHKAENVSSVSTTTIGPGGVPIEVKQEIARASVNMFPIMGFIQLSGPDDMGIIPYFGAAAGYQVLLLSGDDFTTQQSFEGTFSGWGWQLWGGAGLPMGGRTRLTGELFVNGAELGRDATDELTGLTVHETVNGDGMGMRFGLAWGF